VLLLVIFQKLCAYGGCMLCTFLEYDFYKLIEGKNKELGLLIDSLEGPYFSLFGVTIVSKEVK